MGESRGAAGHPSAAGGHGAGRLDADPVLGLLPPARPARITFDGWEVAGREDEPLLAAILAGGVRVLRTMPKTGEARGGYCLVGRCTDCMVVVDGRPNVRACVTPLRAGMRVETQIGLGPAIATGVDTPIAGDNGGGS
jgi:hypothetical protein